MTLPCLVPFRCVRRLPRLRLLQAVERVLDLQIEDVVGVHVEREGQFEQLLPLMPIDVQFDIQRG